jgi:hypothetical protein
MTPTPIVLPVQDLQLPTDYRVDYGPLHDRKSAYFRANDRHRIAQFAATHTVDDVPARVVPLFDTPQSPNMQALADWWRSHPRVPAIHAFPPGSVEQGRAMEWEWAQQNMLVVGV